MFVTVTGYEVCMRGVCPHMGRCTENWNMAAIGDSMVGNEHLEQSRLIRVERV